MSWLWRKRNQSNRSSADGGSTHSVFNLHSLLRTRSPLRAHAGKIQAGPVREGGERKPRGAACSALGPGRGGGAYLGCCPPPCCWSRPRSRCLSQWRHWHRCSWSPSSGAAGHMPGKTARILESVTPKMKPPSFGPVTTWTVFSVSLLSKSKWTISPNSSLQDSHSFILKQESPTPRI